MAADVNPEVQRHVLMVAGLVQGVGFRPHVFRLATKFQLHGFVRNEIGGVRLGGVGILLGAMIAAPFVYRRLR